MIVRRAPGRVNLIGDHTDYSLLPVLPFAIQYGITATASTLDEPVVRIDSTTMPGQIDLREGGSVDAVSGWHRYAQAAVNEVGGSGLQVLIDADLPSEGGLSSSSAFTVVLVATLRTAAGLDDDHDEIVATTVRAERSIGLAGGTMDQNIIVRAEERNAMRIDFHPFGTRQVPVPDDMSFVAAHSGDVAAKGGAAMRHYNDRVLGCHAAAERLAAMMGVEVGETPYLAEVVEADDEAVSALPEFVVIEPGSRPWVQAGVVEPRRVAVRSAAAHVFRESTAVAAVEEAMLANDRASVGRLLDASHTSLQEFGSTTDALDRTVEALRAAGADGARVTGAGFGGYTIAVCSPSSVEAVVAAGIDAGGRAFEVRPSRGLQ